MLFAKNRELFPYCLGEVCEVERFCCKYLLHGAAPHTATGWSINFHREVPVSIQSKTCIELFLESINLLTEQLAAQILPAASDCQVMRRLVCHVLCMSIRPLLISDSSPLSCITFCHSTCSLWQGTCVIYIFRGGKKSTFFFNFSL